MNIKPQSRKEARDRRRRENFIGRSEQTRRFEENLLRDDPVMVFSITGEGGVGKSTLLKQFANITNKHNAIVVSCDDTHPSPASAMGHVAEELAKAKFTYNAFDERYKEYRKLRQEVEGDPKAPRGAIDLIARGVTDAAIKSARWVPGASPFLEHVDEKAAGETLSQFVNYAIDRWGNKDEVRLMREPERILTPLFLELVAKVTEKQRLLLIFDVFERTSESLAPWLLALFDFEYGDFNTNLIFVVAGREPLGQHWTELTGDICHMPLEPFTPEETRAYLDIREIADDRLVEQIHEDTGGLPVLVELLAGANPQPGAPLPDVSRDAVERFLQWIEQDERRQAALLAAVPRRFNRDLLSAALGSDATTTFNWIATQSFVRRSAEDGWFYHDKVRELMLRYLRNTTPKDLDSTHARMADFFGQSQAELKLEGKAAYKSETWRKFECERVYHSISAQPDLNGGAAVNAFLSAFRRRRSFAEEIAKCCRQSGREKGAQAIRNLADILSEIHRAYGQDDYRTVIEKLESLERRSDLTGASLCEIYMRRGTMYIFEEKYNEAFADLTRAIEFDEKYAWAINNRGITCLSMGRYEDALADFNRAIELDEKQIEAIIRRGETYREMGRNEEALADFNRAIKFDEKDPWAIANRGETYREMSRNEEALADFNRAIELDEKYAWPMARRGETYRMMNKGEEALADFNRLIELNEKDTWAIAKRVETYWQMGRFDEALVDLNRAIESNEKETWAIANRGRTYGLMGRYEEALADLNRLIELNEKDTWAIANRGRTYGLMGRYEEALADFNRLIELNEKDVWAIASRGETYRLMGKYEEALADFNRVIELDKKYDWAIASRGEIYRVMGRYEEALSDLNPAIELNEKDVVSIARRGETYRLMGRNEEALADFNRAIELNEKDVWVIAKRGETYWQMGGYEKALADFDRAIELDETYARAMVGRGLTHLSMDKYEEALTDFNRAIELDEKYALAMVGRGVAYRRMNRYEDALADYRVAVELISEDPDVLLGLLACYRKLGLIDEYQQRIESARDLFVREREYNRACFAAIAGDVDDAIASLRTALERGEEHVEWAKRDPNFYWALDDPRFAAMLQEIFMKQ